MPTAKQRCILLCALFATSGCFDSDSKDNRYQMELRTASDIMPANAKAQIRLFGYDLALADAPATTIAAEVFDLSGLPETLDLTWPSDAADLIVPAIREDRKDNARFFFSVRVDVDGDGLWCPGDLRRDFDLSPIRPLAGIPSTTVIISMTEQQNDSCSDFSLLVPVIL